MDFRELFKPERRRREALGGGYVAVDPSRCVQCGICSFNCPVAIDVRRHVWLDQPIHDSHCLTCGECIARCPRNVLRMERLVQPASLDDQVEKR
jgi:NAD-dependent dihydropyrimidine dehydrogenase PreA subunit